MQGLCLTMRVTHFQTEIPKFSKVFASQYVITPPSLYCCQPLQCRSFTKRSTSPLVEDSSIMKVLAGQFYVPVKTFQIPQFDQNISLADWALCLLNQA